MNQIKQGYKQTKVGMIPEDWEVEKIEKIAPLQRGYDLPTDSVRDGIYPVVYSNGILRFHNEYKAKSPGIITGRSGTIGKVTYVENNYWPHNTSLWVTNFYGNNPKFIYYMYINMDLTKFSAGSGVPTLNRNDVHIQNIALPPLKEQQKIAEILTTWDDAISKQEELIEAKIKQKKALSQKLLSGEVRFSEFTDKWKIFSLNEVLKERKTYQSKGLELEHVSLTKEGVVPKSERYERDFLVKGEDKQYKITKLNDICYNPANLKFGVICKNTYGNGIFSPIYVTFETKKGFNIDFLGYFLTWSGFINKVRRFEEGTVYERMAVNPKDFLSFKTKLPSLEEQQKIVEVLSISDKELDLLKKELEELKLQKKALMQKLLTGEVRVKV